MYNLRQGQDKDNHPIRNPNASLNAFGFSLYQPFKYRHKEGQNGQEID